MEVGSTLSKLGLPEVSITSDDEKEVDNDDNVSINFFLNSKNELNTISQLLRTGTDLEDNEDPISSDPELGTLRFFNHFYDPQNAGRALTVVGFPAGHPSPGWVLTS